MGWFIVDGHQDIATALLEAPARDFGQPAPEGQALSLPDAKRGGLGLILGTIFATEGYWKGETPTDAAERQMACYDQLLVKHQADLFRVESRGDLALCRRGGPIGMLHLMEGADPLRSPRELGRWVERGVRVVGLAWNTPNRWCGGCKDDQGVTREGLALLDEMRQLDVLPDLSHLNPRAVDDVLAHHAGCVVASHSNCHALRAHRRNLTDSQIRRVAERDGVVGVVLYNPFLAGDEGATLDTVLAHIRHIADLVGPDHVALGSDLDGGFSTKSAPQGIGSVADLRRIGEALGAHDWPEPSIEKVMGGNWLRVLRRVLPE
ncbi:MAG: dipeptidase [Planctomycetia bacterium]